MRDIEVIKSGKFETNLLQFGPLHSAYQQFCAILGYFSTFQRVKAIGGGSGVIFASEAYLKVLNPME